MVQRCWYLWDSKLERRYWTGWKGRVRCPTYGCGVGFHCIYYEQVLLKSVASIVVDKNFFYRSTQPTVY